MAKKWFSEWWQSFSLGVGVTVAVGIIAAAWKSCPYLWRWLHEGDGEVAHRAVFMLAALLFCLGFFQFFRPLRVRVVPIPIPANETHLIVQNLGGMNAFRATIEILEIRLGLVKHNPRRTIWNLGWARNEDRSKYLQAHQSGNLNIATAYVRPAQYSHESSQIVGVYLMPANGEEGELVMYSGDVGQTDIDIKVTVISDDPKIVSFLLQPVRPFVGRFTIKGSKEDGLSIHHFVRKKKTKP